MKGSDKMNKIIVYAYLLSQLAEFVNGKERIFQKLNLSCNTLMDEIIKKAIKMTTPNYLAYLEKMINLQELKKFFKKDLRIIFVETREKAGIAESFSQSPKKEQEHIRARVEELFAYCEPIFFNFESVDELASLFNKAEQLGKEKNIPTAIVFIRHPEELLRACYPNKKLLEKKLTSFFSAFSEKEIFAKVMAPFAADPKLNNPERLAAQEKRFKEINASVAAFLKIRLQEILTITR